MISLIKTFFISILLIIFPLNAFSSEKLNDKKQKEIENRILILEKFTSEQSTINEELKHDTLELNKIQNKIKSIEEEKTRGFELITWQTSIFSLLIAGLFSILGLMLGLVQFFGTRYINKKLKPAVKEFREEIEKNKEDLSRDLKNFSHDYKTLVFDCYNLIQSSCIVGFDILRQEIANGKDNGLSDNGIDVLRMVNLKRAIFAVKHSNDLEDVEACFEVLSEKGGIDEIAELEKVAIFISNDPDRCERINRCTKRIKERID